MNMSIYSLFITCPRGLESILATELQQQQCRDIVPTDGGVACSGGLEQVYRVNLYSRTASRVLLRVGQCRYRNEMDIFQAAKKVAWERYFKVSQTFKVKIEGKRAKVKSLDFVALKIKDAICDRFRERFDARPSVNKRYPDIRIHAFIAEHEAQIFLDTSGEALFKRGYRQDTGEAPLRENLAAGLLLATGYDGSQPLQDPFCGSGTIAIEAALIASNHATGLTRKFGFEKLIGFNRELWQGLRLTAQQQIIKQPKANIAASDKDKHLMAIAKENAKQAGIADWIDFSVNDVFNVRANGENGIMVSNPPYGVRLEEIQTLHALYPQLGSWLKQHYAGWLIGLFTADRDMPKLMRLQPKRKIPLYNGKLDCRLFLLDMVAGSNR